MGLSAQAFLLILACSVAGSAFAKTFKIDCSKNGKVQPTIDSAADGDTIEITGTCMENILIRDKALTLKGAATGGPHGITGVAADTDGVSIQNSRGTHLEGLTISNPLFAGVRIRFNSDVSMTDCEVSNSFAGAGTAIWVQEGSYFRGTRLILNDNLRGLGAVQQSRAFCFECDLNDNGSAELGGWAATATWNSVVSLLDSAVTGLRGINATQFSYIDIDCFSHDSTHACSLNATGQAGFAFGSSTVAFYDAGNFWGRFRSEDRSEVQLLGARQQSAGNNIIGGGASLRVEPFVISEDPYIEHTSQLKGNTGVGGFSHALFYGSSTVLDGNINCDSGGDAWVDPDIGLGSVVISGCAQAPDP